jgi:hypothetical protein
VAFAFTSCEARHLGLERRLQVAVVELHDHLALADGRPLAERDLENARAHLGRDIDLDLGIKLPGRRDGLDQFALRDLAQTHGEGVVALAECGQHLEG